MHLYININNKVLPKSHIHIWLERFPGILDMIFFNHIQELGFKGLGFRQSLDMGFHHKERVGRALQFSYFVVVELFTFGASTLLSFHFAR
jgi:hypothetical protein